MKLRTSPRSRRRSSRRKRSSVRAISGSESKTRSISSTWKIALESDCAGPSWTSCASRVRSPSWASTIRIWISVGIAFVLSETSDASPRSRNSHVLSRFRIASSRRDRSVSYRPRSPRVRSTSRRTVRSRPSAAPASAATAASSVSRVRAGAPPGSGRRSRSVRSSLRSCQRAMFSR